MMMISAGSCVISSSQCPVVAPCGIWSANEQRCPDGSCKIAQLCNKGDTCPSGTFLHSLSLSSIVMTFHFVCLIVYVIFFYCLCPHLLYSLLLVTLGRFYACRRIRLG